MTTGPEAAPQAAPRGGRAVVVGAGIGGLAAAIALRRAGWEVVVVERAESLDPVGYALALAPNALAALDRLGVGDAVRAAGVRADTVRLRSRYGRILYEQRADEVETYGSRRADLQRALHEALPGEAVRLGCPCSGFHEEGDRVRALLADGEEEGDLLVGADGINSVVREQLFPGTPLRYGAHAGWRALVADPGIERTFTETWGPGSRFGFGQVGGGQVYWYVAEAVPEGALEPPDAKAEFARRFALWHDPIPRLIEATEPDVIRRTFIYDLRPLSSWSRGRVTLVGDAAHAMTPNLGQGAAQALEDAVALGASLREANDVEGALRLYEQRRVKRANLLLRHSRQSGRIAQLESPLACRIRDAILAAMPNRRMVKQQERYTRADLPTLND